MHLLPQRWSYFASKSQRLSSTPTSFCILSLIGAALSLPDLSSTPAVPIPYPTLSFQPALPSSPPNSSFIEAPTIPPSSPSIPAALSPQSGSPITLTSTYAPVLFGGCTSTPDVCGPHMKINSDHIALSTTFSLHIDSVFAGIFNLLSHSLKWGQNPTVG